MEEVFLPGKLSFQMLFWKARKKKEGKIYGSAPLGKSVLLGGRMNLTHNGLQRKVNNRK